MTPWPFNLEGRIAVVTGGLGKLGPIWIEALVEAGARVAALDLPQARPPASFEELHRRFGHSQVKILRANVTERQSLEEALVACVRDLGEPSILVNNAGIDQPPNPGNKRWRLEEIPIEANRLILDVNVLGVFLTTQVFSRPMARARRGSIVNIGSLYASVSPDARCYDHLPGEPPFLKPPLYGVSKAGVVNLSRYLATHLAGYGIRVNTLSPGGVRGGQDDEFTKKFCSRVPLGRMAEPADLKGPLLFLASDASSYVTGTELLVDGGYTAW